MIETEIKEIVTEKKQVKTQIIKKNKIKDAKKIFWKKGPCSRALFFMLNREFGFEKENEDKASDPLSGGVYQQGHHCGMLWGASLAVGAESYRNYGSLELSVGPTIETTGRLLTSFVKRAKSSHCSDITNCDQTSKLGLLKFFLTGKPISCTNLAAKWAPEAVLVASETLSSYQTVAQAEYLSCASEVVKKMGGTEEEMAMVSGFAGGLGLSGGACGALSAAIWMNTLSRVKKNTYKSALSDPVVANILQKFYENTDYEIECSKICRKKFESVEEHSEYIKNGGCEKLIKTLASDFANA